MARWRRHVRPFAALLAAQIAAAASYGAEPAWAHKHKELSLASSDAFPCWAMRQTTVNSSPVGGLRHPVLFSHRVGTFLGAPGAVPAPSSSETVSSIFGAP